MSSESLSKYSVVLERMKRASGLGNESSIAKTLDITPQAMSNFKKAGEIPADRIIQFALKFTVSVDWLLTGEGSMRREKHLIPEKVSEAPEEYGGRELVDPRRRKAVAMIAVAPDEDVDLVLRLLKHRAEGRELKKLLKEEE